MSEDSPTKRRGSLGTWAQVAEVVAGVGVLITLVVLVFEVRANTEATQAASYAESMDALNEWRLTMAADPDLAELWANYSFGEPDSTILSDPRTQFLRSTLWGIYENAYYANRRGLLGTAEWERFRLQSCRGFSRDTRYGAWDVGVKRTLTEEFSGFVESSCSD